jgi:hypothetical protein
MVLSVPLYKQADATSAGAPYLLITVVFSLTVYLLESYLDFRQLRRFSGKQCVLPKELTDYVKPETFTKTVEYGKDKFSFKIVEVDIIPLPL